MSTTIDEIDTITAETIEILDGLGVRFGRGAPEVYLSHLTRVSSGFTLPMSAPERRTAILLKSLYTVWNITIDDEIDLEGQKTGLDDSFNALNAPGAPPSTAAAKILGAIFDRIPPCPPQMLEMLRFDIWEVSCAFRYEHMTKQWPAMASSYEYDRHCGIVGSLKIFLDIDSMLLDPRPDPISYARLRRGYEHLSLAIKYASDIGTLKRELVSEDTLNSIRIVAAERDILPLSQVVKPHEYAAIRLQVEPIVAETKERVQRSMDDAKLAFGGVEPLDTTSVRETASYIVDKYTSEYDPFGFEGEAAKSMDTSINLLDSDLRKNPYPVYARLREHPIRRVLPMGVWVVSRHHDVVHVLKNPHVFSSAGMGALFKPGWLSYNPLATSVGVKDGKEHARLRSLLIHAFTPHTIAKLETRIREWTSAMADRILARQEVDFVAEMCSPLPGLVIADMLGLDPALHHRFQRWTSLLVNMSPIYPGNEIATETREAIGEIEGYMRGIIASRRQSPRDDVVTDLLRAKVDGQCLSDEELISFLFILLVAGYESTKYLLGLLMIRFTDHPEEFTKLREDPAGIAGYVDEILRIEPPGHGVMRLAMEDTEIGGTKVPKDSLILVLIGSANHDASKYDDPELFDATRGSKAGLSFGHGSHFCLGAPLARLEARIMIEELAARFEGFSRMQREIEWNIALLPRGPVTLPIRALPHHQDTPTHIAR